MKRTWKALAFLATVIGTAFAVSTVAFAVGGGSSPPAPRWRTTLGPVTWTGRLNALYPGAPGERLAFTVTNAGHGTQRPGWVRALIAAAGNGDAETATGVDIRGCRASWFRVTVDHGGGSLPARVAPGTSYRGAAQLTMRDSGTNQDACRGAAPAVTIAGG